MARGMRWDKVRAEQRMKHPPLASARDVRAKAPPTARQLAFIGSLRDELGRRPGAAPRTRQAAAAEIDRLLRIRDGRQR